jgi:hypothetical protein
MMCSNGYVINCNSTGSRYVCTARDPNFTVTCKADVTVPSHYKGVYVPPGSFGESKKEAAEKECRKYYNIDVKENNNRMLMTTIIGSAIVFASAKVIVDAGFTVIEDRQDNNKVELHGKIIPPFSTCEKLDERCNSICKGKSDDSPVIAVSRRGDQGVCEDKCDDAVVACGRQRDGAIDSQSDDFKIRSHFCSAICSGSNTVDVCREKCQNNSTYWGW